MPSLKWRWLAVCVISGGGQVSAEGGCTRLAEISRALSAANDSRRQEEEGRAARRLRAKEELSAAAASLSQAQDSAVAAEERATLLEQSLRTSKRDLERARKEAEEWRSRCREEEKTGAADAQQAAEQMGALAAATAELATLKAMQVSAVL